jgi:hypothetical protein
MRSSLGVDGRKTASGHLRAAVRNGMPDSTPNAPGLVGRGAHDSTLRRVAVAADDHRAPAQLRAPQHLDGGYELVKVDVKDPEGHV